LRQDEREDNRKKRKIGQQLLKALSEFQYTSTYIIGQDQNNARKIAGGSIFR
jgi:hypothetical protein